MGAPQICFVTNEYPPDVGGVAKSAQRIVTRLAKVGFEIHVFAPERNEKLEWLDTPPAIGRVCLHRVVDARFEDAIQAADTEVNFALFHGFSLPYAYPCLNVAARGRRPVIASIRGIDGMQLDNRRSREVLRRAAWITSVSTDSLIRASQVEDVTGRCSFIANGIEATAFRRWRPTPENAGVVGTVATFRPKKNIPMLLEAYSRVDESIRRKLLLVGDFKMSEEDAPVARHAIAELSEFLGISKEVTITGYVHNREVPEHLSAMRVFVLSSNHEGLPNSVLEAAAAGMPIVATAVDGVKDILQDGVNGLLVRPGDSGQMCLAIERVLQDEHLARSLGSCALELASRLSPEFEQREYAALYKRLIDSSPSQR